MELLTRTIKKLNLEKPSGLITLLSKYDHTVLSIPQHSEDIRPRYAKLIRTKTPKILPESKILDVQLKYIVTHYAEKHAMCRISETGIWHFISNQIEWLHKEYEIVSYYNNSKITTLQRKLNKVFKGIDASAIIPVSDSKCGLTPWTSLSHKNRLYFFNWEVSDGHLPMLIDFFHFVFQSQIVEFNGKNILQVKQQIDHVISSDAVLKLSEKFSVDVKLHYKLYLLFATSYYLRLYINQKFPHQKMHNFIDVWHEALNEI